MFVDIHTHILSGVDDGPENDNQMYELLKALCDDGIGTICCTPHCHPGYYGGNFDKAFKCFSRLKVYIQKNKLNMEIFLGNELHYSQGCLDWIEENICRTINRTRYVLVDFDMEAEYKTIEFAVRTFLHDGYIPILAHIERYPCFGRKNSLIEKLHSIGAVIQMNASSVVGKHPHPLVKRLLRYKVVDVIASDTHNLQTRPPLMRAAYQEISQKYGERYADRLFIVNPNKILKSVHQEEWRSE